MLNIRRVDHAASRTHCWRVTVQRRKRIYVRHFSDGRHGGTQPALEAAQIYRDTLIQTHPPLSKPAYCAIRKENNRSGISGLTRVDTWDFPEGVADAGSSGKRNGRLARGNPSTRGFPSPSMERRGLTKGR